MPIANMPIQYTNAACAAVPCCVDGCGACDIVYILYLVDVVFIYISRECVRFGVTVYGCA